MLPARQRPLVINGARMVIEKRAAQLQIRIPVRHKVQVDGPRRGDPCLLHKWFWRFLTQDKLCRPKTCPPDRFSAIRRHCIDLLLEPQSLRNRKRHQAPLTTCRTAFAARDSVSFVARFSDNNFGNLVAKYAGQRDNVGEFRPACADAYMKIQIFAENIKFKADNLFAAVMNSARPAVIPPCYCKYALGH